MNEGEIAFLGKGFGFIKIEGRTKDLFFHAKGLIEGLQFSYLNVGDKLSFRDIESGDKGDAAVGVTRAENE